MERGFGDEHGGYLIQPEDPVREPQLPAVDPVPASSEGLATRFVAAKAGIAKRKAEATPSKIA